MKISKLFFICILVLTIVINTMASADRQAKKLRKKSKRFHGRRFLTNMDDNKLKTSNITTKTDQTGEAADCEVYLQSQQQNKNNETIMGTKGAAMTSGSDRNKTIACILKAFEISQGKDGSIKRKSEGGSAVLSNNREDLDKILTGQIEPSGKEVEMASQGKASLRKDSKHNQTLAALQTKESEYSSSVLTKVKNQEGVMEGSGTVKAKSNMKQEASQLNSKTEELTELETPHRTNSRNGEITRMKHQKKIKFDVSI